MAALIFSTNREEAGTRATHTRQTIAEQHGRLTAAELSAAELFEHRDELARIVAGAYAVMERHAPDLDATCRECSRPADRVPWPCPTRVDFGVQLFSTTPPPLPHPQWRAL